MVTISERTIAIRIDEEFHRRIKIRLAERGITLKDYILCLVEDDLKDSSGAKDEKLEMPEIFESIGEIKQTVALLNQLLVFLGENPEDVYKK